MRILITGGAGFIGSHLAEALLVEGQTVFVIDNYSTGRRDNLRAQERLTVHEGTISDTALVDRIFDDFKPEVIVHAAASYKDPEAWFEDVMTNIAGTVNVVKASRRLRVRRFIYFQTSLCYGLQPLEQPITLTHPLYSGGYAGGSSYAVSKTGGEQYIELGGFEFLSFRLANAYGPRNLSGPLPTFYHRLTTGKPCFVMDTRRDFIYIRDLIEVVMKAVHGMGRKGYYHISSGSDFSIKELFDATVKALGIRLEKDVEVRQRGVDDVYTILLDPSKTNREFQWTTTTPLESGVQAAIDWYKRYGITQTYTHLKQGEQT